MDASFHIRRAIAELEVARDALHKLGHCDSRINGAIVGLKERESERIVAAGQDANYWSETEAALLRREAKRAARRAEKEKS